MESLRPELTSLDVNLRQRLDDEAGTSPCAWRVGIAEFRNDHHERDSAIHPQDLTVSPSTVQGLMVHLCATRRDAEMLSELSQIAQHSWT